MTDSVLSLGAAGQQAEGSREQAVALHGGQVADPGPAPLFLLGLLRPSGMVWVWGSPTLRKEGFQSCLPGLEVQG